MGKGCLSKPDAVDMKIVNKSRNAVVRFKTEDKLGMLRRLLARQLRVVANCLTVLLIGIFNFEPERPELQEDFGITMEERGC